MLTRGLSYLLIFLFFLFAIYSYGQEIEVKKVATYSTEFTYPTDIIGDGKGNVFVLDGMNSRIVRITERGKITSIVPRGIDIYKAVGLDFYDGLLYVTQPLKNRILILDRKGRLKKELSFSQDIIPVDLCVTSRFIFVSEKHNHQIIVLDNEGKIVRHWGSKGQYVSNFLYPGEIIQYDERNIAISDILNSRILLYSMDGSYPRVLVGSGVVRGTIYRPKGLAMDKRGRLWVADGYIGTLQAFLPNSDLAGVAVSEGKVLRLKTPVGLYIDRKENLWVVESMANRVSRWQIY